MVYLQLFFLQVQAIVNGLAIYKGNTLMSSYILEILTSPCNGELKSIGDAFNTHVVIALPFTILTVCTQYNYYYMQQ